MGSGLLDAAGFILGGAMEGGGKAVKESFAERMKQEAAQLREDNMARIANLYADARQEKANVFTSEQNKLSRDAVATEAEKSRGFTKGENEASRAFTKGENQDTRLHQERMATDANYFTLQMKELDNEYAKARDATSDAKALARLKVEYDYKIKALKEANTIEQSNPGAIGKQIKDLMAYAGMTKEKATELVLASLTGERDKQQAAIQLIVTRLKTLEATGMKLTEEEYQKIKEEAFLTAGATLPTAKAAPGGGNSFDKLDARVAAIGPADEDAPGRGILERGGPLGRPSIFGHKYDDARNKAAR